VTSKIVYLSLGSNIGDRAGNLQAALEQLGGPGLRILRTSPAYETEPVEFTAQRWFLNLVAEAETELFPLQLLARVGRVERALGRVRGVPKGPRTIDIDILFYGRSVIHSARLEIPHPGIAARRFVLVPLADLAPGLRHPVTRKTVLEMLDAAPKQAMYPAPSGSHTMEPMNWNDAAEDFLNLVIAQTPRPVRESTEAELRALAESMAEDDGKNRVGVETVIAAWVRSTPETLRADLPRQMERFGLDPGGYHSLLE
jgi:2-amino-4-hydroxy-6-hydroxymethyldihydropteridine diphosphokinase